MATEFKVLEKKGWKLNPNDNKVNDIIRQLGERDGHCPTIIKYRYGHDQCPCSDYLTNDKCHCGLYVKLPKINKDESERVNTENIPYSC